MMSPLEFAEKCFDFKATPWQIKMFKELKEAGITPRITSIKTCFSKNPLLSGKWIEDQREKLNGLHKEYTMVFVDECKDMPEKLLKEVRPREIWVKETTLKELENDVVVVTQVRSANSHGGTVKMREVLDEVLK